MIDSCLPPPAVPIPTGVRRHRVQHRKHMGYSLRHGPLAAGNCCRTYFGQSLCIGRSWYIGWSNSMGRGNLRTRIVIAIAHMSKIRNCPGGVGDGGTLLCLILEPPHCVLFRIAPHLQSIATVLRVVSAMRRQTWVSDAKRGIATFCINDRSVFVCEHFQTSACEACFFL